MKLNQFWKNLKNFYVKKQLENISKDCCPNCKGPPDNGFDRCYPPNPYWCKKCSKVDSLPQGEI